MTYLKTLTAPLIIPLIIIAGLALLTACGGAAPPANNTGETDKPAVPCDTNPFGDACLADTNLDPRRVEIVTACGTDKEGNLCEDAIEFVCDKNFQNKLCDGIMKYEDLRNAVRNACLARTGSQDACNEEERINTCNADAFSDNCDDEQYMTQRERECQAQALKNTQKCMATEERICGATGKVLLPFCDGITAYYDTLKTECAEGMPKRNDVECAFTRTRICTNDGIFDEFCTGLPTTNASRRMACESGVKTREDCEPTVERICTNGDIFDDFCTGLPDTNDARIKDCIKADNAGEEKCAMVFTETTPKGCLTNPFANVCAVDTDFDDYVMTARMNRFTFCQNDDTNSMLCAALRVCRANLFDPTCGTYFERARIMHCETNKDVADCPNTTYGDWVASFNPALRTAVTAENQFALGTPGGVSTSGASSTNTSQNNKNLATATYNGVALGGDATDGFAYFSGMIAENGLTRYFYAGIFSGTDLGAPLPAYVADTEPVVVWNGSFRATVQGVGITDKDFNLNVNLQMRKIDAFFQVSGITHYKLDADFNDKGVLINGTILRANFTDNNEAMPVENTKNPGVLTGLIGQEGAVAAFHSDGTGSNYAGGFVVVPPDPCIAAETCVDTAKWLGSFEGANALDTAADITASGKGNQFLQGTATGLTLTGLTITASPNLTISTPSGGEDTPAVAFGEGTLGGVVYRYAGLLSGVNLGAPITGTTFGGEVSAMWSGQFTARGLGATTKAFNLEINFTNATIEAFVQTPHDFANNEHYLITGSYDRETGVITGRGTNPVTHARFGVSNNVVNRNAIGNQKYGTLTGLIGSDGAVGAFIGNGYSGGFVAKP